MKDQPSGAAGPRERRWPSAPTQAPLDRRRRRHAAAPPPLLPPPPPLLNPTHQKGLSQRCPSALSLLLTQAAHGAERPAQAVKPWHPRNRAWPAKRYGTGRGPAQGWRRATTGRRWRQVTGGWAVRVAGEAMYGRGHTTPPLSPLPPPLLMRLEALARSPGDLPLLLLLLLPPMSLQHVGPKAAPLRRASAPPSQHRWSAGILSLPQHRSAGLHSPWHLTACLYSMPQGWSAGLCSPPHQWAACRQSPRHVPPLPQRPALGVSERRLPAEPLQPSACNLRLLQQRVRYAPGF